MTTTTPARPIPTGTLPPLARLDPAASAIVCLDTLFRTAEGGRMAEASELGWGSGRWPSHVVAAETGTRLSKMYYRDGVAEYRSADGSVALTVLND